ncbi:hypothetical protein ACQPZJ_01830 [Actinoplanes sp. CA-054009]
MTAFDTTRLQQLGKRRRALVAEIAKLDAELDAEIFAAAHAEPRVPQTSIIEWTGHARETARRKEMTPEQLEEERRKRRAKSS